MMSSTYGWLTESALSIERPIPLKGVSQQSQLRLSYIVRKQQENQQQQLNEQRPLFVKAAREGKLFTHDAPCSRRWTRPSKKPLDWATRKLADKNDGVGSRIAADELKGEKCTQDPHSVASHLDRKSKLYDRLGALLQQKIAQRVFLFINYAPSFICLEIVLLCCLEVGGLEHSTSAVQLLQLHQKRRITERIDSQAEPAGPRLSAEALAELLNFNEGLAIFKETEYVRNGKRWREYFAVSVPFTVRTCYYAHSSAGFNVLEFGWLFLM
uniref:Uncharacterized protein n=1 Tax=Eimeria tenella TaxID=5802 RepID=H9B9A4_EIMTE|nr:hypothetical protein [Eimeria tenella]